MIPGFAHAQLRDRKEGEEERKAWEAAQWAAGTLPAGPQPCSGITRFPISEMAGAMRAMSANTEGHSTEVSSGDVSDMLTADLMKTATLERRIEMAGSFLIFQAWWIYITITRKGIWDGCHLGQKSSFSTQLRDGQ